MNWEHYTSVSLNGDVRLHLFPLEMNKIGVGGTWTRYNIDHDQNNHVSMHGSVCDQIIIDDLN